MPGPVIAPNGLFADFGVISSPLALTVDDAHSVIADPSGSIRTIQLNATPSDGETYQVSNVGGGANTILLKQGALAPTIVSIAPNQAAIVQYDSALGVYIVWGKVALI